jgi:hypothetical protein
MIEPLERQRISQLPPLYRFFLNPYRDVRFWAACPGCGQKLRQRKLPLAIHVDDWGMAVINKTCRYCPHCDLLIAHEDELRAMIDQLLAGMKPEAVGSRIFVLGTIEREAWRRGMDKPLNTEEMLAALHDFCGYDNYQLVGGWQLQEPQATGEFGASRESWGIMICQS